MTNEEWNKLSNGEKAWKLNSVMECLNDEEGYYYWLSYYPDGESYLECLEDFKDDEDYADLEKTFVRIYKDEEIHDGGLYRHDGVPKEIAELAHWWDKKLGLPPIEILTL